MKEAIKNYDRIEMNFSVDPVWPVIKGTTVSVGRVVRLLIDEEWTREEFLSCHRNVREDDLREAMRYASGDEDYGHCGADCLNHRAGEAGPPRGGLGGDHSGVDPRSTYSRRCGQPVVTESAEPTVFYPSATELYGRHAVAERDPFIDCVTSEVHIGRCVSVRVRTGEIKETCDHCGRRFEHGDLEHWAVEGDRLVRKEVSA